MRRFKGVKITAVLLLVLMLVSCSEGVDRDVVEFVDKTKKQKSDHTADLPYPTLPPTFKYAAYSLRSPFESFGTESSDVTAIKSEGGPDLNRPREPLENYPLDSLHMVGTLEREGQFFGLLRDAQGIVYRITVGNYIGQNSGKIEKISESAVELKEWLADGKGGWREHLATIPLVKPKQ